MALPVTIPNTFANATSSIPLANLDANFVTIYGAVNGIGNGSEALANVSISGGAISNTSVSATTLNTSGQVVFNDAGANVDFRVEGDTDANLLFVDASTDRVGIGTSSPSTKLVVADAGVVRITALNTVGTVITQMLSSTDTGFVGTDSNHPLDIFTNSVPRMRIDSAGNVGIGTSTPNFPLSILSSASTAQGIFRNIDVSTGPVGLSLEMGALVGTTPTTAAQIVSVLEDANAGNIRFLTRSSGTVTERMRILANGTIAVNDTSVSSGIQMRIRAGTGGAGALEVRGQSGDLGVAQLIVSKFDNNTTSSQIFVAFSINNGSAASGNIVANGANQAAFASSSDIRLKENVATLQSQLTNICALRPVEFDYIASEGGGHQIGFVAQEIQEIYPDAVGERSTDGMLTVTGWDKSTARLVKAIQEQQAIITALTARVAALESN